MLILEGWLLIKRLQSIFLLWQRYFPHRLQIQCWNASTVLRKFLCGLPTVRAIFFCAREFSLYFVCSPVNFGRRVQHVKNNQFFFHDRVFFFRIPLVVCTEPSYNIFFHSWLILRAELEDITKTLMVASPYLGNLKILNLSGISEKFTANSPQLKSNLNSESTLNTTTTLSLNTVTPNNRRWRKPPPPPELPKNGKSSPESMVTPDTVRPIKSGNTLDFSILGNCLQHMKQLEELDLSGMFWNTWFFWWFQVICFSMWFLVSTWFFFQRGVCVSRDFGLFFVHVTFLGVWFLTLHVGVFFPCGLIFLASGVDDLALLSIANNVTWLKVVDFSKCQGITDEGFIPLFKANPEIHKLSIQSKSKFLKFWFNILIRHNTAYRQLIQCHCAITCSHGIKYFRKSNTPNFWKRSQNHFRLCLT